ncbi:uncharacterized protein M421DRAFT_7198 [Didymella exigua CBS 183.55]|uniref:Uncharacterized protein n=1 Tax=Didymella exigua CBS 183.55 TaxID=1150837 RepID=A0A6A5RDD3_9PLEO|nr:uncharacterized protein M421DRAFT_7198 [Didymella exigua CBS 183.55]KAF1926271.1 hypothetical protein M421DRAFT_7198 [Didymella exigua CBS 183.55]
MHRKNPISVLVYNYLFPSPSPTDPPSFSAHLSKNLVGEVRIETANFYGSLDTIEARYPGLNYAHGPHRKRLGRFPHHRRLFGAFDALGLTESEMQGFCRWEGTLWARERYERDEGVKVVDTTGMEIGAWVDNRAARLGRKGIKVKTHIEVEIERVSASADLHADSHADSPPLQAQQHTTQEQRDTEMPDTESDNDSDDAQDDVGESVGFELNARLLHAAALRDQGNNVPMDPEWEAYLKEAQERGELNMDATREALRTMAGHLVNSQMLSLGAAAATAADAGQDRAQALQHPAAPA